MGVSNVGTCFSSGNPKGAMLTHGNLVSNLSSIYVHLVSYGHSVVWCDGHAPLNRSLTC